MTEQKIFNLARKHAGLHSMEPGFLWDLEGVSAAIREAVAAEREDNRGLRAALMAIVEAPGGGPGKRIATQALADRQEPAPVEGAG